MDPKNPGAVDMIINLGDYWDETAIRGNREDVLNCNEEIKFNYKLAYNYIGAAKKIYDNMNAIYESALNEEEIFKIAAGIVNRELIHKELTQNKGKVKKFFASAITPEGPINYIESLISGYKKVYVLHTPIGLGGEKILNIILNSALFRGFNIEAYYCPMEPETKMEHLLVPDLGIAFVTFNFYHKLDISGYKEIDFNDYIDWGKIKGYKDLIDHSCALMDELLQKGVQSIKKSKKTHDLLENNYIPNMNFEAVEAYRKELVNKYILP